MTQTEIASESASYTPRKNWLFTVTSRNWEILKTGNVWAVRSQAIAGMISKGDRLIFYVKGSQPPSFMGVYQVMGDWRHSLTPRWSDELDLGQVIYSWEVDVKPIRLGTASVKDLTPKLGFIEKKQYWSAYLRGTPANFKRPIPDGDVALILSELEKPSYAPSHSDLIDMISQIGEMLGFVAKAEESTPNGVYRCDIT